MAGGPAPDAFARIDPKRQLKAVLTKNWLLTKKNARDTAREFAFPIVLMMVLLIIRSSAPNQVVPETPDNPPSTISPAAVIGGPVWFAPCARQDVSDAVYRFMTTFGSTRCFACNRPSDCSGAANANSDSLEGAALAANNAIFAAVVFENPAALASGGNTTVNYQIRMDSQRMPGVGSGAIYNTWAYGPSNQPHVFNRGFLQLQLAVEQLLGNNAAGQGKTLYSDNPLQVKEYPFPQFTLDIATSVMANIIPIYLLLIFSLQVRVSLQRILEEKEKKIKEGMRMMGLSDGVYIASWLITCFIKGAIMIVIIVVVCKVGKLFQASDVTLMLVYFLLFNFVCVAYVFMLTTFFSTARTGGAVGMLLYLALFLPSLALQTPSVSGGVKYALSLLAPTGFALGNLILNQAEGSRLGVSWSNMGNVMPGLEVSMAGVMGMLALDAVLYTFFAWYLDKVMPTEYGTHKHPLFLFSAEYWRPRRPEEHTPLLSGSEEQGSSIPFENVPAAVASRPGVRIVSLEKSFNSEKGPKKAVDRLSLTLYEGQITCLLGHNGAGKTTTLSMLTGLFAPTGGDAFVYGRSILTDMQGVRELTSVCPQHDILFDELSVHEHLMLFGGIKGIPEAVLLRQVTDLINEVGLGEKTNAASKTLSGGQKRRLSVAISLMGDPKVVFLDEPTSGLDPQSRRAVWELVERRKEGRVIVLTTHFMDEADILGDRIAIMSKGALAVVGSSLFLKNRFGIGYHLTLAGRPGTDFSKMQHFVSERVPHVTRDPTSRSNGGSESKTEDHELSLILPLDEISSFPALFEALDTHKEALALDSYGISVTTLEEVFLRLAEEEAKQEATAEAQAADHHEDKITLAKLGRAASGRQFSGDGEDEAGVGRNSAFTSHTNLKPNICKQFKAMMLRSVRQLKRDRRGLFLQMVLPSMFVAISFVFRSLANVSQSTPLVNTVFSPSQLVDGSNSISLLWGQLAGTSSATPAALMSQFPAPSAVQGMPHVSGIPPASLSSVGTVNSYLLSAAYTAGTYLFAGTAHANVTMMYNTSYSNGLPVMMSLLNNAILRQAVPSATETPFELTYSPLPLTPSQQTASLGQILANSLIGFYIAMGFAVIPGLQSVTVVKERENKAKQLQLMMGLSTVSYWAARWLCDAIQFLIPWLVSCAMVQIFGGVAFHGTNFLALAVLLFFYGAAVPGLAYSLSFMFEKSNTAQTFIMLFFNFGTIVTFFLVFAFQVIPNMAPIIPKVLTYVFMLFPNFALAKGFADVGIYGQQMCVLNACTQRSAFEWDLAGAKIVYLAASVPFWFVVLQLVEHKLAPSPGGRATAMAPDHEEDEDVREERQRVDTGAAAQSNILVQHLRKVFPGPDGGAKVAVRDLVLGLPAGECFGLLGPNGAGKTTSLSMLTGDIGPTTGTAFLTGVDVFQHRNQVYQQMGYCPQFDALFDTLTTVECLEFYASVKGLQDEDIKELIDNACKKMLLEPYRNTLCKDLSGGNKRKLSLCIAFIGAPATIFLDEPSTGVDPVARRGMWTLVSNSRAGRTIIVTTHLMEEADALCSRIGILVNGSLACLGSPQHLKHRYGSGYQMEVRTSDESKAEAVKALMLELSAEAKIMESHGGHFKYQMPQSLSLSRVFGTMEANKSSLSITDYAVSQTSLEQVFLNFARRQHVSPDS